MTTATKSYEASAKWLSGKRGHYGEATIRVDVDGAQSSGGWSTPGGPNSEAQDALHWLFAGNESDDDGDQSDHACALLDVLSLDQWLDSDRTDAVVMYDGQVFKFTEIRWA